MRINNELWINIFFAISLILASLIVFVWFIEIRFQVRKTIRSFDDYGRKRNLLKIREKSWLNYFSLSLVTTAIVMIIIFLISNFYYYTTILIPLGTITFASLALFVQNKNFNLISINTHFLDEEYKRIKEWEHNFSQYLSNLDGINIQSNEELVYFQNLMSTINSNLKNKLLSSKIENKYAEFSYKVTRQIESLDGSVESFKNNFTLIAKEYIETQNMNTLNLLDENSLIALDTYQEELSSLHSFTVEYLSQQLVQSLRDKELKNFKQFPAVLEVLKSLHYQLTLEDILMILEAYPMDSESDRSIFLDTIYSHGFITFDFLAKHIVPKDEAWFFNDTFFNTFSEADVKKLFYIVLESDAENIVKSVLRRLKPKYISYLQDLCQIHVFNPQLEHLIYTYDDLLTRMNQFTSIYNSEENFLIALIDQTSSQSEKEELEKLLKRDLSTPNISKQIINSYLTKFSDFEDLFNLVVDTYFVYLNLTSKNQSQSFININNLVNYMLEKIALLDAQSVKVGLLFLLFDLFVLKIQWYATSENQELAQELIEVLNLNVKMNEFDGYLIQEPKRVFSDLILNHNYGKKMQIADLHSLLMRIEVRRMLLEEIN